MQGDPEVPVPQPHTLLPDSTATRRVAVPPAAACTWSTDGSARTRFTPPARWTSQSRRSSSRRSALSARACPWSTGASTPDAGPRPGSERCSRRRGPLMTSRSSHWPAGAGTPRAPGASATRHPRVTSAGDVRPGEQEPGGAISASIVELYPERQALLTESVRMVARSRSRAQVRDSARSLAGPFDGIFGFHNAHVAITANWDSLPTTTSTPVDELQAQNRLRAPPSAAADAAPGPQVKSALQIRRQET